ncbi:MAG: DegV family protein [Acutalibacteraceae bacterium]|nr:DegV family protein [Acutalibacteraceae bacterium]
MEFNEIKIVADSSSDVLSLEHVNFSSAPLKIITADKEYTDNAELDVRSMVDTLLSYKGKSSTSCPNAADWLSAFGNAKYIFVFTITATLSGSYNSAMLAKQTYEEEYPERRVFVLNTLTAGPEISLMIDKVKSLILEGASFDEVCNKINEYTKNTGLLFMLQSLKNLANNGRVSPLVAKMAGFMGIRLIGKASAKGDLQPLDKCRGEKNAIDALAKRLYELGYNGAKIKISHCFNEKAANDLKELIVSEFPKACVEIYACGGLCSFYAEKGGLLIGFEKE